MSSVTVFVGLDYHQDGVQVCVLDLEGQVRFNANVENEWRAIRRTVSRFGRPGGVAIEACCGAANLAQELHDRLRWPVQLAHPGFVRRMKQNPDKTDLGDARLLADLVRVGYLPKVWLAPEEIRRLRRLVRFRQQRVIERRNVKLRIRALLRDHRIRVPQEVGRWTKRFVKWLETTTELKSDDRWLMDQHLVRLKQLSEEIREVEKRLQTHIEGDVVVARLLTLAGVGLVTATTLRAEIGRFDRFDTGKQLARFCGVSPRNASSGARQADAGMIKAGNPGLRTVLIELAHRLIWRGKGRFSDLAYKLRRQGKPTNVVVVAVANRWVRWLYHQMQPAALAG